MPLSVNLQLNSSQLSLIFNVRQNTTEVEMLHYKDSLSCCAQNDRINRAMRITLQTGNLH